MYLCTKIPLWGVCRNTNLLNRFCLCQKWIIWTTKQSVHSIYCVFVLELTCSTLAWLFTQQTPRLVRPLGPNEDWPHQLFSTKVEHQYSSGRAKHKSVKGGSSGWGGGGGKATWPWGPNMFFFKWLAILSKILFYVSCFSFLFSLVDQLWERM